MEESKLFKKIWRFNAIVIMLVGIVGLALSLFAAITIYQDITRDRNVRNIVNIEETQEDKEKWRLGNLISINGSSVIMVPLYSEQNISTASYSKSASSTRNYLFINVETNSKYWLFDKNDYLITSIHQLPNTSYSEQTKETKAILYYVVKSDTNNNNSLTSSDLKTVAISKPNGQEYLELLKDIDFVNGYKTVGKDSVIIVFQRDNIAYSATINLDNLTISNEEPLPSMEPK
ncbi:hypothetical protein F9L16_09065 [Agarivorans sp. B2Z047]|uniref:hypothetical protein n=1 Tax=Agarivorans sp. B2Z047 TaxID=2652721 RepID=UPI00128BBF77|nr:hypothetical protein [Agarivorans sp. B2Z047]MPW29146.1 hypothetical protein [Agarivorans sp. B2Z047]UQN41699.1 hypothetical protein LQZ07_18275 [Agarivorans sp. B2Z047]